MRRFQFLFFLLFCQITFGQTNGEKILHGKISVASGIVEGVTIVNLVNEKSTISDSNGEFYILAKAEDLLVFSSVMISLYFLANGTNKNSILTLFFEIKIAANFLSSIQ